MCPGDVRVMCKSRRPVGICRATVHKSHRRAGICYGTIHIFRRGWHKSPRGAGIWFTALRTRLVIAVPDHVPAGAPVWLTAVWVHSRGERSAAATPVTFNVSHGVTLQIGQNVRAA